MREMFDSKLTRANQGMGKGRVLLEKQVVEGRGRFGCQKPQQANVSCSFLPIEVG